MSKNITTKIRYIGIPAKKNIEVPGFCLDYSSKKEAEKVASILSEYSVISDGSKKLEIKIVKGTGNTIKFLLSAQWSNKEFKIDIENINESIVEFVKFYLKKVQYYIIVVGFTSKEKFELIPPSEFSIFKSEIEILGDKIRGNNLIDIDWINLFSSDESIGFS